MKKIFLIAFWTILFLSENTLALELSAKSAVLYEPSTDRIIYSYNENSKMPMASTTKIATAITVLENANLDDVVTVSKKAAEVEGSSIWLEEGEHMTVSDLLYGLMLASGNDAAIALSEHLSDDNTDFVHKMNELANKLGCHNTNFENPNGLDQENHYTTAIDLAKITAYSLKNEKFREIVSTKKKSISWENHEYKRVIQNHNKLLSRYEGCIGVKTGFTKKDGRCLVSAAERNGIMLIAVTLNAPDDWNDHTKLLDYGFDRLHIKQVVDKNDLFTPVKINNLENAILNITYKDDFSIPVTETDVLNTKTIIKNISAPVLKNDVVGYTEVYLNNSIVGRVEIISNENIDLPERNKLFDTFIKILTDLLT